MLEVKNVSEIEIMDRDTQDRMSQLKAQIKEAESELELFKLMKQTSKWFESVLPILQELDGNRDNIEVLKKVISYTMLTHHNFTGLIGFDENWILPIETKVISIRLKLVPTAFHEYGHHRNWYDEINALKDRYPTTYINDTKVKKISLIGKAIESINAWCLHRLYVLDENLRFFR